MAMNWTDPSKNTPADLDAYRKFVQDTDPTVDHSDLYRPKTAGRDDTGTTTKTQTPGTRGG